MKKEYFNSSNMSLLQTAMFCLCIATLLSIIMPNTSFAAATNAGTGSGDAIAATLCVIVNALQGAIGKAVATIAIVVLGIGLFLGKLSWPLAVATAIGIGMIFGASELVGWIAPSGKGSSCGN